MPQRSQALQDAIDQVNQISQNEKNIDPFSEIGPILDGQSTSRQPRKGSGLDICDAVIPANTIPSTDNPSVVVAISPDSFGQQSNLATNPRVQTITAYASPSSYVTVAQANQSRQRLILQNVGSSGNIFVIFGKATQFGGDITSFYHLIIQPGDTYIDDSWVGRVDVSSDSGASLSTIEFTRQLNVSQ